MIRTKKTIPDEMVLSQDYDAAQERELNVIGKKIAEVRNKKGISLASLCDCLSRYGVELTRAAIGKWETGETVPNAYQLIALCNVLGINNQTTYFMRNYVQQLNEAGEKKVEEYRADLIATGKYKPAQKIVDFIKYIEMPVSNLAVSAGTGAFLDEGNYEMVSFPEGTVPVGADFGIRVSGDSMEPVYHDGQIVWVHECEELFPGQVGVFTYDGEGFLKVYSEQMPDLEDAEEYADSEGGIHAQPILISYNKAYAPRVIQPGVPFQIVGRVL